MRKLKAFTGSGTLLATLAVVLLNMGATAASSAEPSHANAESSHTKPALTHSIQPHVANPHLHGVKPATATSFTGKKHLARHWVGRWSFADWAVLHRGLGNVTGQVFNANGSPAAGVSVALRGAKGKVLARVANRHATHTSAAGTFTMWNVRIGNYRVRASHGKVAGATPVRVGGGSMAMVSIRI